jgi:class III lanthionine synthetase
MKVDTYLRDIRHTDKFRYTLSDELFYEPLETQYRPFDDYRNLVSDLLRELDMDWNISRQGFWFFVHPVEEFDFPAQGWKAHVSATIRNGASILKRVARIALLNGVPFKFSLDRNFLAMMSSKRWPRGGSGKFITLYPSDLSCFKNLLEHLYAELQSEEGPYILSDKRYKDCRVLYYRYGGMARTSLMDITGEQRLVIYTPDGEAIPDVRHPYFAPPPWASDPFPSPKVEPQEGGLNGKYFVKRALGFSNSGGVYLAEDRETGAEVVIKEARAYTAMADGGTEAIKTLKKEQEILELLRDTGIAPRPLDSFYIWENFFLVEEYLSGLDIREIMLTQSPLLRVQPSLEDTIRYYEICIKIYKNLARVVDILHKKGIVFGDLSATNIRVDSSTYDVRLIDFEGALMPGIDVSTYLYTPGFKSLASIRRESQDFEDDLYALASNMMYILFPISVFSSLRDDLFDTVLKMMLADLGWSRTELFNVINGLSKNEITCASACELLDKPAEIVAPSFDCDVDDVSWDDVSQGLGDFILANIRPDRDDGLFPADPFIHRTNTLSLGFGACGVLYSLKKCCFEIPRIAYDWLERQLDKVEPEDMPPGLLTGASGIAWCLWELGFEDRAVEFMKMANQNSILKSHHSYFYGMAGVGMTNLYFHLRTKGPDYLAMAEDLADALLGVAQESDRGIYWETDDLFQLGYGYGQSGVALFLLRMTQLSGKKKYMLAGRRALEFDLSHGVEHEQGTLSFPRTPTDTTFLPYIEEGAAGIARVAMRYGSWDRMEMILSEAHRKYAGFAGLIYGITGFVDIFTDAFLFSNNAKFLEMAKRPLSAIRNIYIMKQPGGLATPGDNLFRISCDYATGVAGVMRALRRFTHLDEADFTLDEVISSSADHNDKFAADAQRRATISMS